MKNSDSILKQIRNAKGISRQELSNMSGVSAVNIQLLEDKGDSQIMVAKLGTLVAICKALNIQVKDIVPHTYRDFI